MNNQTINSQVFFLFFKIVKKLVPEYLYNLLPLTAQQRSGMSLRSANDFSLFSARTERYNNSFFPPSTHLWNSIGRETRETDSIRAFKKALCHFFNTSSYNNCFDYAIDRYSSILHPRLRLNCCTLNYYLFKINCAISPACACGANRLLHKFLTTAGISCRSPTKSMFSSPELTI